MRVLIIDDNSWMQRIVAKIVSSYGWEPLIADNGYDGIALALEHKPDVIILDLIMPDMSGMQVLRLLKRLPQTSSIPVLILSVATEAELLMDAMRNGAAGFIRKPFTRSIIYDKIIEVLPTSLVQSNSSLPAKSMEEGLEQQAPPNQTPAPASLFPLERYRTPSDEEKLRRWLDQI